MYFLEKKRENKNKNKKPRERGRNITSNNMMERQIWSPKKAICTNNVLN